ncbi:hypothetical protein D3C71_2052350 [compost metagenome]
MISNVNCPTPFVALTVTLLLFLVLQVIAVGVNVKSVGLFNGTIGTVTIGVSHPLASFTV